jgi:hypothetical protein
MHKKYLTTLIMAAIAFSPLVAMKAASLTDLSQNYRPSLPNINTNQNSSADVDVDTGLNIEDDTEGTQVQSNTNANANALVNANLSERLNVLRRDLDNDGTRSAVAEFRSRLGGSLPNIPNTGNDDNRNGNGSATTTAGANGMINARENANERAFEVASDNSILLRASDVSTQDDLRNFALAAIDEDKNLNSMSFDNGSINVGYRGQGRFIGLLPVFLNVDVTVDQDGNVEFDYPWYSFLVVKDMEGLEERIEAEVEAAIGARASGGWTNSDRAEIAAAIATALRAHYESMTATSTDTQE